MAKSSTKYVCSNCGASFPRWSGQCMTCQEWNTLEEEEALVEEELAQLDEHFDLEAKKFSDIDVAKRKRTSSGFTEFDRVLGGEGTSKGFVEAEVVLLSGDPGVGKSTLLLQALANISNKGLKSIYVSAEESEDQIALRGRRILGKAGENLEIVSGYNLEAIMAVLRETKPKFVVIDSIQTISSINARGIAGGISQVKSCTSVLVNYAKSHGVNLIIVGHINKEGNVAGPKTLEHLVDAVFHMEGDERSGYRLIRSLKNRFGTTNEVGILGLQDKGVVDIKDASKYFISDDQAEGVARSAVLEGSRVLVVEVQALVNSSFYSMPKRVAEGISLAKLQVITAMLQRHSKLRLADKDIYINVASGLRIKDPAVDFAIASAIASSVLGKKLPKGTVIMGELSLTGRIGSVNRLETRKKELKRLGYSNVVTSDSIQNISKISGIF